MLPMLAPLMLLFLLVPIIEIVVILQVGHLIGTLPTIALLIVDSIAGAMLLRSQGRAAWRRFAEALQAGRQPAREVLDGVLVVFGAALLLTPGFVTDVLGASLLIPPTRALWRRVLVRRFAERMVLRATGGAGGPAVFGTGFGGRGGGFGGPSPGRGRPGHDYDVDATASEHAPDAVERGRGSDEAAP